MCNYLCIFGGNVYITREELYEEEQAEPQLLPQERMFRAVLARLLADLLIVITPRTKPERIKDKVDAFAFFMYEYDDYDCLCALADYDPERYWAEKVEPLLNRIKEVR